MISEILFLGVDQMKQVKPSLNTVVVSILDVSEASHRPRLGGFRSVLHLEFEDTEEEKRLASVGAWPDEPTQAQHNVLTGGVERIFSLSDARKITSFLNRFAHSDEPLVLIAHCYAGISRSAAVASWAANQYSVALDTNKSPKWANKRVLRLLDKAHELDIIDAKMTHKRTID